MTAGCEEQCVRHAAEEGTGDTARRRRRDVHRHGSRAPVRGSPTGRGHAPAAGRPSRLGRRVYDTKGDDVSWYQATATITLELLDALRVDRGTSIIDLGGGASVVVDHLLARTFTDVSVLDVSQVALDNTQARLGPGAERVHWLHRDIFDWTPERRFDLWHDRAVFHFLIDEDEREAYLHVLRAGIAP